MRSKSLSIAARISPAARAIYGHIADAASSVGIDWLVVGATARDMIYEAAFDIQTIRATADIDFGVHVADWEEFSAVTEALVTMHRFSRTQSSNRLQLPESDIWIDIIPFGAVAGDDGRYQWPDEPEKEMSVLGFQQALETAVFCRVDDDPVLDLKVVHPAVLIMLKIVSWRDRKNDKRTDAQDVAYVMSRYTQLDNNENRVYDDPSLYEDDLEMDTIGARLAGRDLASLASGMALDIVRDLVQREIDLGNESELLADMMRGSRRLFADDRLYGQLLPNLAKGIDEELRRST